MSFYASPADMFSARADRFKKDGDRHWAMAKNEHGNYHFGKAKYCYNQAAMNREKAAQASQQGLTFCSSHTSKH